MATVPLSNVSWGPIDALERDHRFTDKWIEPYDIKRCLDADSWIVSGEKGSGKSAIRRAINDIYRRDFHTIADVDFQKLTFRPLYENLVQMCGVSKLSETTLLSNYWQYAILLELINAAAKSDPDHYAGIAAQVPRRRVSNSMNERLLQLLQEAWNKIDAFTGVNEKLTEGKRAANLLASGGIEADLLNQLHSFPLDIHYKQLRAYFFNTVESRGDRIILILDGFDQLITAGVSGDAIKLIFETLVDAILNIRRYEDLPPTIEIKAFIPHDRYLGLSLRDSDKVEEIHASIRWTKESLMDLVGKRIMLSSKTQSASFAVLWRQVFPDTITNPRYNLQEDSFEYILRHTMYRPRQIQIHLNNIAKSFYGRIIDPSNVPNQVSESCKAIANNFINEYTIDYPWLRGFVSSLHMRDNILPYVQFRDLVYSYMKNVYFTNELSTLEEIVDILYTMGLFGVVHFVESGDERSDQSYPPTRESRRHYVDFYFKNPKMSISGFIRDDTYVAFHPVFVDYVSLKTHNSWIVG